MRQKQLMDLCFGRLTQTLVLRLVVGEDVCWYLSANIVLLGSCESSYCRPCMRDMCGRFPGGRQEWWMLETWYR